MLWLWSPGRPGNNQVKLSPDQIKQGIVHAEQMVRDAALGYFAKSFSRNPTVMPFAIEAVETYGWEAAFEYPSNLRSLVQTEETLRWVIERMERIGYPETRLAREESYQLAATLVKSDATLLARHHQRAKALKLPPMSPDLNPHAERFVRSIKSECLAKMIFFGERQLRRAVSQFVVHCRGERNHQGLGNDLIEPGESVGKAEGEIRCRQRLGGLLRYYHRAA